MSFLNRLKDGKQVAMYVHGQSNTYFTDVRAHS